MTHNKTYKSMTAAADPGPGEARAQLVAQTLKIGRLGQEFMQGWQPALLDGNPLDLASDPVARENLTQMLGATTVSGEHQPYLSERQAAWLEEAERLIWDQLISLGKAEEKAAFLKKLEELLSAAWQECDREREAKESEIQSANALLSAWRANPVWANEPKGIFEALKSVVSTFTGITAAWEAHNARTKDTFARDAEIWAGEALSEVRLFVQKLGGQLQDLPGRVALAAQTLQPGPGVQARTCTWTIDPGLVARGSTTEAQVSRVAAKLIAHALKNPEDDLAEVALRLAEEDRALQAMANGTLAELMKAELRGQGVEPGEDILVNVLETLMQATAGDYGPGGRIIALELTGAGGRLFPGPMLTGVPYTGGADRAGLFVAQAGLTAEELVSAEARASYEEIRARHAVSPVAGLNTGMQQVLPLKQMPSIVTVNGHQPVAEPG